MNVISGPVSTCRTGDSASRASGNPPVFRARTDVPQGDIAADLFHESVPDAFVAEVFAVMARANWRTFQLLTKRHGRMRVPGRR
jgi:protein gp37